MRRWVVNASPVIALAKVGYVDLLRELPDELVVPEAVARERRCTTSEDPARLWLDGPGGCFVRATGPVSPRVVPWDLGDGHLVDLAVPE